MKKIAIVTDAWHPQVNGVVSCYDRMLEQLPKRGYEITVIHPGLFRTVSMPGYPEIRLTFFPRKRLKKILSDLQPGAVHIAVEGPLGFAARALCRKQNIPFTTCYHTNFQMYLATRGMGFLTPAAYAFLRWFHNNGVRTMVATESLRRELEAHGFKNLALWPLGVDIELFKRNTSSSVASLTKPVFAYFGRVAIEKNVDEFMRAELPGTKLVIGDGPDRKRLEEEHAGRARFVGYKKGQELVDWLSLCDVSVFTSRTDTFGLVILEALACGVPVAAHDVMGPRDILTNGVDGYLSENLADAAVRCLSLDKAKCRITAEQFSWERSADAFVRNLDFSWGDRRELNPD